MHSSQIDAVLTWGQLEILPEAAPCGGLLGQGHDEVVTAVHSQMLDSKVIESQRHAKTMLISSCRVLVLVEFPRGSSRSFAF
jgi:hypothetical protein